MINLDCNYVRAYTISDAWREVMQLCIEHGIKYKVGNASQVDEFGSYIGQYRVQLPNVTIEIIKPSERCTFTPENYPFRPTDNNKIGQYFAEYLMNPVLKPNEVYRYSTWIAAQIENVIKALIISKGKTNQATISVGDSSCSKMSDPPCLRVVSFKAIDKLLQVSVFFRSWDLVCGLPENLSGIQLLKEYVLERVNDELAEVDKLNDYSMYAYSDGLHIYSQYFDIVKGLCYLSDSALKKMEND